MSVYPKQVKIENVLTPAPFLGNVTHTAAKNGCTGLAARSTGGRTAILLIRRFFCVQCMAKLSSLGGAVREGATPAGPVAGLPTRTVSALFAFGSAAGLKILPNRR